jgi:predicted nucleic acid-binding protein
MRMESGDVQLAYFDTSAAIKLFKAEVESPALLTWMSDKAAVAVTCDLTRTELRRALHAANPEPEVQARMEQWLASTPKVRLTPAIFDAAGHLAPGTVLRSLDALHVAAAQQIAGTLIAFVAYDKRQCAAAHEAGLPVLSPS